MKIKTSRYHGRGVEEFLAEHGADVTGVIAGFDRLRLRGSLLDLYLPMFMFRVESCASPRRRLMTSRLRVFACDKLQPAKAELTRSREGREGRVAAAVPPA
ncbi:MAG: hypothetical protein Q7S40_30965 [Opitutaceae bacterium]|nr:hypothetical protein [Opitutaceae bacterium]